jgi:hypothetical protein
MFRRAALLELGIVLALPAGAMAQDVVVASGHITAGSPHTLLATAGEAGVDGIDSFLFAAPAAGTRLTTRTVDGTDLGYDLDFWFFGADGSVVGDCSTEAADEVCDVPGGAVDAEVSAFQGVDLDVTVLDVTPVQP